MNAFSAILLLLAAAVEGHFIVDDKTETKHWTTVRRTNGAYRSDPIDFPTMDVTKPAIRCYQAEENGHASFSTVKAGSILGFISDPAAFHDGPVNWYMAKVPDGHSIDSWDGAGQVWFKAHYSGHKLINTGISWGMDDTSRVSVLNFTIPQNVPSGDYLVRTEQIGMNQGGGYPKGQPYLSCAQVRVTNGDSGTPGPLVAFPGAYGNDDPGLYVSVYPIPTSYVPPGPPVWDGN